MNGSSASDAKLRYSLIAVIAGLATVLVGLLLVIVVGGLKDSKDLVSALSAVTSVIGTLVGAYCGVNIGSAGKEKAEAARDAAQQKLILAARSIPEETARKLGLL